MRCGVVRRGDSEHQFFVLNFSKSKGFSKFLFLFLSVITITFLTRLLAGLDVTSVIQVLGARV